MQLPLISIITVTYQAELLIEETVQSVTRQDYMAIEHVLVDGASTDQTVSKAVAFMRPNRQVVSEPDRGLYDAMNKGLSLAKGEYVLFLNAGDVLHQHDVLSTMMQSGSQTDCIYGETAIIDGQGNQIAMRRHRPPAQLNWRSFQMGMCVSHQSMLMRRSIAAQYDLNYRVSADIDWSIRSLKLAALTTYCPIIVSDFLIGGVSSASRRLGLIERWRIMRKHYGLMATLWSHCKIVIRFIRQKIAGQNMD